MQSPPESNGSTVELSAVQLPADRKPSLQFVTQLQQYMLPATRHCEGTAALQQVLPSQLLQYLVKKVTTIVNAEPTLLEIQLVASPQKVTVVGDTHGQFHDVCRLFELFGQPSSDRVYLFNGDYVDRGAWGVETLTLLLAWKWLLPNNVYLIRGNHETSFCTKHYGFRDELKAKYGTAAAQLYKDAIKFFASLPLAALVNGSTLVLHGGLFRAPSAPSGKRVRRVQAANDDALRTGTLDDLRSAHKGGADPDPERSPKQLVASDILWSDPSPNPGHKANDLRGVGTTFGPDVTEAFLAHNHLKLIIRSHEGPDARRKRAQDEQMGSISEGFSVDHVCSSGRLVTVFSAPDYPQFMAEGEQRYKNRAAVLHLTAPDYATPQVESFEADLPRPQAQPFYEVIADADTDHETDELLSTVSDDNQHSMQDDQHDSSAGGCNIEQGTSSRVQQQQPYSVGPVSELLVTTAGSRRSTRSSSRK